MTSKTVINAARFLDRTPELSIVIGYLMKENVALLLSIAPSATEQTRALLEKHHTLDEIVDLVTQLAREEPTDG